MRFESSALAFAAVLALLQVGCAPQNAGNQGYPFLGPALKAALPKSVASRKGAHLLTELPTDGLQVNFFGNGAESIQSILAQIDSVIANIDQNAGAICDAVTPVPYSVDVFSGTEGSPRTIVMYGQCSVSLPPTYLGDPGLFIIGTQNGVTSVWMAMGESRTLAQEDALGNIHIISGVGYSNGAMLGCNNTGNWDGCSYAVSEIQTNINWSAANQQYVLPAEGAPLLEMTAAGMGIGYCGVQLAFDGTNVFAMGSAEDLNQTCDAPASGCYLASDFSTATGGVCDAGQSGFSLVPIGRDQATGTYGTTWAGSRYPSPTNVTLNGGPDAANPDALHFGGSVVAPSGVTQLPYSGPSPSALPSPVLHLPFPPSVDSSIRLDAVFLPQTNPSPSPLPAPSIPHNGFHYSPILSNTNPISYYAMAPGTIVMVGIHYSTNINSAPTAPCYSVNNQVCSWNVNVALEVPPNLHVIYQYETMAGAIGPDGLDPLAQQLAALTTAIPASVTSGLYASAYADAETDALQPNTDYNINQLSIPVNQGDLIGALVQLEDDSSNPIVRVNPVMHITTQILYPVEGKPYNYEAVCGEPYLANILPNPPDGSPNDALARALALLANSGTGFQLCYGTYYDY